MQSSQAAQRDAAAEPGSEGKRTPNYLKNIRKGNGVRVVRITFGTDWIANTLDTTHLTHRCQNQPK
jgi:recombinational DNA repair protein RecR